MAKNKNLIKSKRKNMAAWLVLAGLLSIIGIVVVRMASAGTAKLAGTNDLLPLKVFEETPYDTVASECQRLKVTCHTDGGKLMGSVWLSSFIKGAGLDTPSLENLPSAWIGPYGEFADHQLGGGYTACWRVRDYAHIHGQYISRVFARAQGGKWRDFVLGRDYIFDGGDVCIDYLAKPWPASQPNWELKVVHGQIEIDRLTVYRNPLAKP